MKLFISIVLVFLLGIAPVGSYAQEGTIQLNPGNAKITGSVSYSVMGVYKAHFSIFKGMVYLDQKFGKLRAVYLEINAASIKSDCSWCDKLARSRRALNAARYPKIIFSGDRIVGGRGEYKAEGSVELRGIKIKMILPFQASLGSARKSKSKWLKVKGTWRVNRKDFNIVWNKVLDRGGVLVGDEVTVNFEATIEITRKDRYYDALRI